MGYGIKITKGSAANARIEEGWFKDGLLQVKGRIVSFMSADGNVASVYEGEVMDGKPHGIGKRKTYPDRVEVYGLWVGGERTEIQEQVGHK